MTDTNTPAVQQALETECATTRGEISRTDTKAALLVPFNGAALAGLYTTSANPQPPLLAQALGAIAGLALLASTAYALLVVRPRLDGRDRASFPAYAREDEQGIARCVADENKAGKLATLSRIAHHKFRGLSRAINLTLIALPLLAIAAVDAVIAAGN